MSESPTASGPEPGGQQPSEAEIRAYLEQLRGAPVDQVLAEVCSALINAAQVKVGRPDARLLLDVVAAVGDAIRDRADADLVAQVDNALTQLRLAQVDAEKELAGTNAEADDGDDSSATDTAGQGGATPPSPSASGSTGKRLWTPGT